MARNHRNDGSLQDEAHPITSQAITRPLSTPHIHPRIHRHHSHRRSPTTTQSPYSPHTPDRTARHFDRHLSADVQLEFSGVHKVTFPLDRVPASRRVVGNVRHAPHSSVGRGNLASLCLRCGVHCVAGGVDSSVPCKVLFGFLVFGF
jgi:hypothetical protein